VAELIDTLRAIVRDEMARQRVPDLGIVTQVHARDSDSSDANHQVHVRLAGSGIELQHVPVAVGRLGISLLPQVGETVLVVFVQGDLNAPVVVGSLYDAKLQPPVGKPEELVYEPSDAGGDKALRRVHLALGSDVTLTLDDETLTVKLGSTELVMAKDGDITLSSAAKLSIKTQGDISVEAGGNFEVKAQGNLTLSGVAATVEGQGSAKLKAPAISLAGNTQFSAG
jgi:phage baseplate assembly protein gpV